MGDDFVIDSNAGSLGEHQPCRPIGQFDLRAVFGQTDGANMQVGSWCKITYGLNLAGTSHYANGVTIFQPGHMIGKDMQNVYQCPKFTRPSSIR